jgi:hypothetical protein
VRKKEVSNDKNNKCTITFVTSLIFGAPDELYFSSEKSKNGLGWRVLGHKGRQHQLAAAVCRLFIQYKK